MIASRCSVPRESYTSVKTTPSMNAVIENASFLPSWPRILPTLKVWGTRYGAARDPNCWKAAISSNCCRYHLPRAQSLCLPDRDGVVVRQSAQYICIWSNSGGGLSMMRAYDLERFVLAARRGFWGRVAPTWWDRVHRDCEEHKEIEVVQCVWSWLWEILSQAYSIHGVGYARDSNCHALVLPSDKVLLIYWYVWSLPRHIFICKGNSGSIYVRDSNFHTFISPGDEVLLHLAVCMGSRIVVGCHVTTSPLCPAANIGTFFSSSKICQT